MKQIILLLACILLGSALTININPTIYIKSADWKLEITSTDAYGFVKYQFDGLPEGIKYNNNVLSVGPQNLKSGYYPVKIKALDQKGYREQRIIVFIVGQFTQNVIKKSTETQKIVKSVVVSSDKSSQTKTSRIGIIQSTDDFIKNLFDSSKKIDKKVQTLQSSSSGSSTSSLASPAPPAPPVPSTSSASPLSVNDILKLYGGSQLISDSSQSKSGTYPTVNFPTDKSPNAVINTIPLQIQSTNAQYTNADKNIITQNDIVKNAIIERSITASKSVANLIQIVEQAKANKNVAILDINKFTDFYNQAISYQRAVQAEILSGEQNLKKLQAGIDNALVSINDIKAKIRQLQNKRASLEELIITLQKKIDAAQDQRSKLIQQTDIRQKQLNQLVLFLNNSTRQASVLETYLKQNDQIVKQHSKRLGELPGVKLASKNKIDNIKFEISQLQKKILLKQNQLDKEQEQFSKLLTYQSQAPLIISAADKKIRSFSAELADTNTAISNTNSKINQLKFTILPALKRQTQRVDQIIQQSKQSLLKVKTSIPELVENPLKQLNNQLQNVTKDLAFLKNQIDPYTQTLRKLYIKGNDANTAVINAKENLDAVIARLNKQNTILAEATLNLQKARSQKSIAQRAVETLLAQRTDVLPYAIIPNGNGKTEAGTPNGNNYSGSPLGPSLRSNLVIGKR